MPTVVTTVVGGDGNGCPWKKDGMVSVEGVVAPFCFPFFGTEKGWLELMSMLVAVEGAEVVGQRLALASG